MLPKRQRRLSAVLMLLSAAWALAPAFEAHADPAATVKAPRARVVTDWRTGLALYGMDPVAYFAEGLAVPGFGGLEWRWAGAAWRFRNTGNKAAFVENPEVYAPVFLGYDPTAVARGVGTPGNPLIWLIRDNRLYLFHSPQNRHAFSVDPERLLAAADANWPTITATLPADALIPMAQAPQDAPAAPSGPPTP